MKKPVIFTVSAIWDTDANVWSGHCDEIPAAADAPTLDELLDKISLMALDVAPDNHPGVELGFDLHPGHGSSRGDGRGGMSGASVRPTVA